MSKFVPVALARLSLEWANFSVARAASWRKKSVHRQSLLSTDPEVPKPAYRNPYPPMRTFPCRTSPISRSSLRLPMCLLSVFPALCACGGLISTRGSRRRPGATMTTNIGCCSLCLRKSLLPRNLVVGKSANHTSPNSSRNGCRILWLSFAKFLPGFGNLAR